MVLLAVFIIVLLVLLILNRASTKKMNHAAFEDCMQIMMYGVCTQFWLSYSAVFITIVYGTEAFLCIFAAYIAVVIFSKPLAVKIEKISSWDSLTTMVSGIIVGILLTFYFQTYFIGIFLIRAFAVYTC